MCGIVAYLGPKAVDSVLLVGLTRLEYRGYDSAGIAVLDNSEIVVRKEKGKIKDLEELLLSHPVEGNVGIGHTRWATHGEPNRTNAHPHVDTHGKTAVVHNGIVENHHTLRVELIEKGHVFHSETDTEVIPHLFEQYLEELKDVELALKATIDRLEGRYAFVLLYDEHPDRLFFARNGSPLAYGRGKGESFLASDVSAVVPAAKEHVHIDNEQWGWVTRNELHLRNGGGAPVPFELQKTELDVKALDRGGYEHFMLKEIYEQPGIIRRIIQERVSDEGLVSFPEMHLPNDFLNRVTRCIITSAGTSWHAGIVGKFYLEHFARLSTEVDISSEFRYRNPIADGETLVVAISQSGETADTLAGIHQAKAKFCRVLSFVNATRSSIARESNAFIDLMAGPEIGVASTKAYTAQVMSLFLYAMYMAGVKWMISAEERAEMLREIRLLPEKMESILARADEIKKWAHEFRESRDFVFLGRSFNHPTALEGALKLKEIAYVHASGYAGGEFKHGPIALISEDVPVICMAPRTELYEKMVSNIEEVRSRKGRILSICTEGDEIVPSKSEFSFAIPECPDYLTPLLAVIPLQLFAYYSATERGCEPDQPRNLAKSVTVE